MRLLERRWEKMGEIWLFEKMTECTFQWWKTRIHRHSKHQSLSRVKRKNLYTLENIKHKEIILKNSVILKSDILPEIQGRFYKVWEKILRKKICYRDSGLLVCIWKSFTINGITLKGFLKNVDKEEMNLEEMWGYRKKRSPPKERGKNAEGLTV